MVRVPVRPSLHRIRIEKRKPAAERQRWRFGVVIIVRGVGTADRRLAARITFDFAHRIWRADFSASTSVAGIFTLIMVVLLTLCAHVLRIHIFLFELITFIVKTKQYIRSPSSST